MEVRAGRKRSVVSEAFFSLTVGGGGFGGDVRYGSRGDRLGRCRISYRALHAVLYQSLPYIYIYMQKSRSRTTDLRTVPFKQCTV